MAIYLNDVAIDDLAGPLQADDILAGGRTSIDDKLKRITLALIRQYSEGFTHAITTDADATVVTLDDGVNVRHTGVSITADRTLTLSDTNAYDGAVFWVTRNSGGAFNLNVNNHDATLLKALASNTWGRFVYNGTNWYLAAAGAV